MHWPPGSGSGSTTRARMPSSPSSKTWDSPTRPPAMTAASVSIVAATASAVTVRLLDQLVQLAGPVFPLFGVGQRRLALRDAGPVLREFGVQRDHVLLVAGHVFLGHDRVDRAFG